MAIINLNYTAHYGQVVMNYLALVGKETIGVGDDTGIINRKNKINLN